MTKDLHSRVLATMARHSMIRPGDRVGLAVSGGADSLALLRLFCELRPQLGVALVVLHFNHQLRGAEADADERFVKELTETLGLDFFSGRADVATEARLHGWNLEDAARRLRYRFFSSEAEARGLDRVAVAHTASDQAETVLAHLLRGTGIAGLAGIYPVAGLVVRPLLELEREELRAYLSGLGQAWREDATNEDTSRMRARIRRQLIPLLIREFEPATVTRLARLAGHAREDEDFWRLLEGQDFQARARREPSGSISLSVGDLLAPLGTLLATTGGAETRHQPWPPPVPALTRRLVRRIFAELRGTREQLTARHVEGVLDLAAKSQSGAKIDLPGICVERVFDRLVFTAAPGTSATQPRVGSARPAGEFAYTVLRPEPRQSASIVVTEIHRRFNLKRVDWPPHRSDTVLDGGALDFDQVHWPLVLRNWRPGDSYRPQGSRRVRKLKRLLLQSRVPRSQRGSWPVLTSEGKVIWAWGYPVADELAARPGSLTGLIIAEEEL